MRHRWERTCKELEVKCKRSDWRWYKLQPWVNVTGRTEHQCAPHREKKKSPIRKVSTKVCTVNVLYMYTFFSRTSWSSSITVWGSLSVNIRLVNWCNDKVTPVGGSSSLLGWEISIDYEKKMRDDERYVRVNGKMFQVPGTQKRQRMG